MKKRILRIINFLYLSNEKYSKIREYRNQDYIRKMSLNSNIILEKEHQNYKKLLQEKQNHFAFLVTSDDKDYGVITLKKDEDNVYTIGDYLVNEVYQYEGGGVANRFCINYLCNKLEIKYVRAKQHKSNTRGNRGGGVFTVEHINSDDIFNEYLAEVPNFNDEKVLNTKARKVFDKLYIIEEVKL